MQERIYKMRKSIFFFLICFLENVWADSNLVLSVLPIGKNIVLEESSDLNLTCKVKSQGRPSERYNLSWKLPTRSNANGDRITVYETEDQLTITIHHLQEDDSGLYVCELQNMGIIRTRKITVFVRSKKCAKQFFDCGNGLCVPKHYVCDGYVDCPTGYDESFKHCGPDACHGKILCDGRCIQKELCCDPAVDANCTVTYVMPCCHGITGLHQYNNFQHHVDCYLGRCLGYGNTIVFIVASCVIVVLVVSFLVVFLTCRICSQHSDEPHTHRPRYSEIELHRRCLSTTIRRREFESLDNFDPLFENISTNSGYCRRYCSENHVLMNYEDGQLIGIGDCGPKPPPYTETVIGIPPPPYESVVDIPSAVKEVHVSVHQRNEE